MQTNTQHEKTTYVAHHIEQSHLTFMKHTETVAHHIAQISHKQQWKNHQSHLEKHGKNTTSHKSQ